MRYRTMLLVVASTALFASPTAFASGDRISSGNGAFWRVSLNANHFDPTDPFNRFSLIKAEVCVLPKTPVKAVRDNDPYVSGASYVAGPVSQSGSFWTATAQGVGHVVEANAAFVRWNTDLSFVSLQMKQDIALPEKAYALWVVNDPLRIQGYTLGDPVRMTLQPFDSWSAIFPDPDPRSWGTYAQSGSIQTTAPGLEDLLHWTVRYDSRTPNQPYVEFVSNPALNLNDSAITADIVSRIAYDPLTYNYTFNSTGFEIDALLAAPDPAVVPFFDVSTELQTRIDGEVVPEPRSLMLLLLGGLLGVVARRYGTAAPAMA